MITEISPRIAFDPDFGRRHDSVDGPTTVPAPRGEHPDPVPSPSLPNAGRTGSTEPGSAPPPVRTRPAPRAARADAGSDAASSGADATPLRRLVVLLTGYYRDRLAWLGLAVTTLMLCYLGGAAMFWVHAIYLDEPGPQIRPILHYVLDSSAGVLGLTPPLLFVVPFAIWASRRTRDGDRSSGQWNINPVRYALAGGSVFTLITVGGPFAHDTLVARGTWIARHVTDLVGTAGAPTGPGTEIPLVESMLAQLVAGLPVYIVLMWASLYVVRHLTRLQHRRSRARV